MLPPRHSRPTSQPSAGTRPCFTTLTLVPTHASDDYYKIEHECLARYNVSQEQLVSGTASESVGHCRGAWTDVGRGAPCQHRPGGGAVAACVGSGEDLVAPQPPRGPPCVLLPAGRAARREVSRDAGKAGRVVLTIRQASNVGGKVRTVVLIYPPPPAKSKNTTMRVAVHGALWPLQCQIKRL